MRTDKSDSGAATLRSRVFVVVFAAEIQSLIGDQLARVALSVLVFDRTASAAATSLAYAVTFLPAIFGGALVARIGDRLPRRATMITCDAVRALLLALMALPATPLWGVLALLVLAVVAGPAFSAAQVSYLAEQLGAEQFRLSNGLRMIANQMSQVLGFVAGGIIVAVVDPRGALAADAATYLVSAVALSVGLRGVSHRAPRAPSPSTSVDATSVGPDPRRRARQVWRDGKLRRLLALISLAGLFVVPEGLVVPYVHAIGASTLVTGLLLAAIPAGGAIGAFVIVRAIPPQHREVVSSVMAIGCGLPLVITVIRPPWPVVLATWMVSGVLAAYQVDVITSLARSVSDRQRTSVLGTVSACLVTAQGAGLAVFGVLGQWIGSGAAIALAGGLGSALAAVIVAPRRHRSATTAELTGYPRRPRTPGRRSVTPAAHIHCDRPAHSDRPRPHRSRPVPHPAGARPRPTPAEDLGRATPTR